MQEQRPSTKHKRTWMRSLCNYNFYTDSCLSFYCIVFMEYLVANTEVLQMMFCCVGTVRSQGVPWNEASVGTRCNCVVGVFIV